MSDYRWYRDNDTKEQAVEGVLQFVRGYIAQSAFAISIVEHDKAFICRAEGKIVKDVQKIKWKYQENELFGQWIIALSHGCVRGER